MENATEEKIAETVYREISYSKLHNVVNGIGVKLCKDSVISYIEYAKEAYLLFFNTKLFCEMQWERKHPEIVF